MDGVERIMVLGIFAVIVAILGVAAWSVTQEDLGGTGDPTQGVAQARTAPGPSDLTGTGAAAATRPDPRGRRTDLGPASGSQILTRFDGRQPPKGPAESAAGAGLGAATLAGGTPRGAQRPLDPAAGPQGPKGGDLFADLGPKSPQIDPNGLGARGGDSSGPISLKAGEKADSKGDIKGQKTPEKTQKTYKVRDGDTLWSIAAKRMTGGTVQQRLDALTVANPGLRADSLSVGRELVLPGPGAAPEAQGAPPSGVPVADDQPRLYTVASGDTLSSIAKRELGDETRWSEIYTLNQDRMTAPSRLFVGQTIRLPGE